MLDGHSLGVISRFRQSLLTKTLPNELSSLSVPNRGNKLDQEAAGEKALTPAVVENNGSNRLVLTNKSIEEATSRRKRRWNERYGDEMSESSEYEETEESDLSNDEGESDEDNLLEQIKLTEILAPLNHPSEIVSHPAISKTYTSPIYGKLATEIIETIETEQKNLNWLNRLLQVLNGEDWFYLLEENLGLLSYDHGLNEDNKRQNNLASKTRQDNTSPTKAVGDFSQNNDVEKESSSDECHKAEQPVSDERKRITRKTTLSQQEEESKEIEDPFFALPDTLARYLAHQNQVVDDSSDELDILQEYLVNCLQVSIQRQQEYIKNLSGIRNGLVRAEILKEKLFKWGDEMYNKKSG